MLTWSAAFACLAQDGREGGKQSGLDLRPSQLTASTLLDLPTQRHPHRPWLLAAAGTTAAFAAGFAFTEGFAYKAQTTRTVALERSRDARLGADARMRAAAQSSEADLRAKLLEKVSSVCLAGSIAATGTMLLIWLTGKEKRKLAQSKYLLGPMVLREFAGAGLVLREKF